ncbi:orotidine-5'-phosphate decarboxylase [Gimesia aquarii]|uniref:Orotidine 5'-phosphate decarboxylase n=1 Tax=Gimesia aquarii TaxID=2527964 RepID=A0A517WUJ4_9PLAN|nr:orotidine-5'-phosphate decarboxylase [Gimesia aquarii]QDU08940.1 Orotidine 5'-phosphate decarboxylase [Gimesia aquarii]
MHHFSDRLNAAIQNKKTPALVGLDPRFDWLPAEIVRSAESRHTTKAEIVAGAFEEFCFRIIDVVAPVVPAVKPQAAFFEEWGPAGCAALQRIIKKARSAGLVVICDAKRGDIGSTAEAYARGYLAGENPESAIWAADCLTVNPYLGSDTLEPFVNVATERGAGIYVLVRTSNPGAGTFQDRKTDGTNLYECVAGVVEELALKTKGAGNYGAIGAVVGATYPEELSQLRALMPHTPLLVPGYGSQGAGAGDVAGAFDEGGLGAIINSSRGINFAIRKSPYSEKFSPTEWEQAVEAATHDMISDLATHTPAGNLE